MRRNSIPARWHAILSHLYKKGWVDIFDICPAFISNVKYAREVMQQLIKRELVIKISAPLFPESRGAGTAFYTIGKAGFRLIKGTTRGYRPKTIPTSTHLMHYYLRNRLCMGLSLRYNALTYSDIELVQLQKQEDISETRIIPDVVAIVDNTLMLGEIDCSTETLKSQKTTYKTIENKFKELDSLCSPQFFQEIRMISGIKIEKASYLHITTGSKQRVATIVEIASQVGLKIPVLITTSKKIMPIISYDVYRYPSISYDPLFEGIWFKLPSEHVTTLEKELSNDK